MVTLIIPSLEPSAANFQVRGWNTSNIVVCLVFPSLGCISQVWPVPKLNKALNSGFVRSEDPGHFISLLSNSERPGYFRFQFLLRPANIWLVFRFPPPPYFISEQNHWFCRAIIIYIKCSWSDKINTAYHRNNTSSSSLLWYFKIYFHIINFMPALIKLVHIWVLGSLE